MRYFPAGKCLLLFTLSALLCFATVVKPAFSGIGEVHIKADSVSQDQEKDLIQASGHVEIKWDQLNLVSDSVYLIQMENEAVATGNVKMTKDSNILRSDRIKVNYETELGEADNGDLFVKEKNFRVKGERFLKTGKDEYRLQRGTFTTCDGDVPSWKFTANDLDITVYDYATGSDAVFYIKDIPVFYSPYIVFPVGRERQSGFLIPRIGNSSKKGFYLDAPYYWAVSPSQDLTVDLDVQTKRGIGLGIDYRYLRPKDSDGQFKGYLIYDTQENKERGVFSLKGHEFFSPSLTLTSDLNLILDRKFFQDYGEVSGDYNRQLLESTFFITKNYDLFSIVAGARYVNDLNLTVTNNRKTLQQLPTISLTKISSPIGNTPIYLGLESNFTDFQRNEGNQGQRILVHPNLAVYYSTPQGIDITAWGGFLQRLYHTNGGDTGNGTHGDGLFDGGIAISAPLDKVYELNKDGLIAVRHTMIPEIRYSVVQEKNQDRLPIFGYEDRVLGQEVVNVSLTNFVTGKYSDPSGSPLYRELLFFKISQGYQLNGSRRDLLTLVDEGWRFTDIRFEGRYTPFNQFSITTDSRYNPNIARFSTGSLGVDWKDGKGNLAGLSYRYSQEQVHYIEGKMEVALIKPFVYKTSIRYSIDKGGKLETYNSLEYKHQCWSVTLAYRNNLFDQNLTLNFNLSGVGSSGNIKPF